MQVLRCVSGLLARVAFLVAALFGAGVSLAQVNVALQANGGIATASSTFDAGHPASGANNGDRKGLNKGSGGTWSDGTPGVYPDWLQVTFAGVRTINEIDVFTLQDNYTAPVDPTPTTTFTLYGLTAFTVQYWNGTAWIDIPGGSVSGNNLVWRRFTFAPINTDRVRVLTSAAGVQTGYSQIAEVEAWTAPSNNSAFVSQTVPTTMVVGTTYSVSVTLQNTGDTTWTSAARYRLGPQNPSETPIWNTSRVALPASVPPGGTVTFNFNVIAPNVAGTYNFQWQMVFEHVEWFGAISNATPVTVTGVSQAQYIYDEAGRLVELVAPNGANVRYQYDAVGNIVSIARESTTPIGISEFTPDAGPVGQSVTIFGNGFSTTAASNTVRFNGTAATVSAATPTSLTVTVPAGATTGPISVTNTNGTATSASNFTVGVPSTQAPTITGFTPDSGPPGTPVTITGTGFQTSAALNSVQFGGWAAAVSSATATQIISPVPAGVASGKISVTTPNGTAISTAEFYALPPGTLVADVEVKTRLTVDAGSATAITTTLAGKKIVLTFSGLQGRWVSLALTGSTFAGSINTTAYAPNGAVLNSKPMPNNDRLDINLPTSGTYTILLSPGGTDKGTLNAQIKSAIVGDLVVGTASTFTLPTGQMGAFSFTIPGSTTKWMETTGVTLAGGATFTILRAGVQMFSVNAGNTLRGPIALPVGGVYTVLVQPTGIIPTGALTLKIADGPDLTITAFSVGAVSVNSLGAYLLPITYTVKNVGGVTAPAMGWYDKCFLAASTASTLDGTAAFIGELTPGSGFSALAPGATYNGSGTCQTSTDKPPGAYKLFVKTDALANGSPSASGSTYSALDSLVESNENNNAASLPINLLPRPDLTVTALNAGAVTVTGPGSYSVPVTYTVTNIGGVAAPANAWHDKCFIGASTATTPDGSLYAGDFTPLAGFPTLAPGASYNGSGTCNVGGVTAGARKLFVKTDARDTGSGYYPDGDLVEGNENNNVMSVTVNLP